ncbi:MAG: NADH-quinone oxidoreductase subunit N [Bacteroidota bacterium]
MEQFSFSVEALNTSTQHTLPILLLLLTGLVLMLLDAFSVKRPIPWVAALGLLVSAFWAGADSVSGERVVFFGMMETGGIAPMVHIFLCVAGLMTLFFLQDYLERQERRVHAVYSLLVFAVLGMILLANANDLFMTFIGLETMSICLYIFAALFKTDLKSNEAGLKYFLLGAFASAFLLFGISLIYGVTGYTNLSMLGEPTVIERIQANELLFYTAGGLILIGFLFKVAAFPFHNWTPDVYTGTPTPLAGFMATASKMSAFVALGVVMQKTQLAGMEKMITVLAVSALFTMIYGNIVAVQQSNLKRMLAYSSIAHSGYVLLGICALSQGFDAVLFYMLIYTLMNIGAFGLIGMAEQEFSDTEVSHWEGLGQKAPYFAGALAVFLFSLAGIPPLAGFMSKYQVFLAAIEGGGFLIPLAVVGILTSVIGAYYYIRVIGKMFFSEKTEKVAEVNLNFAQVPIIGTAVLVFLIVLFGIFPSLLLDPIQAAFAGSDLMSVAP